jgi:NADH:ubiquinone oxidoreductase subunit
MAKYITGLLDKVKITADIVKQNGGITGKPFWTINICGFTKSSSQQQGSLYQVYRTDALKNGTLIGEDKYGNKYYENRRYFVGRSRWIIYNDEKYHLDYDGSQVPAEWYGWLHYKTDLPPTVVKETSSNNIL